MSGIAEGQSHENRSIANPMYLRTGDPGMSGGGTYTGSNTQPTLEQYENIFGPAARDIKVDHQRHKRHQRWHLPDALKGSNQYLTDRIDGLITDATNSPFTRNILPYVYLENPDQKIKWNVYSFDEGIASRVPYESAARVLPQTKRSFAGYTVRQGLAIAMEHNFMVSTAGRENFKNQLTQLVGSIQMTNDLDVHVALLSAPSYQKHMNEKYYDTTKTTAQSCRQYIDLFGIMQKVPNALDILIEDAKNHLKTWGSAPPTFLLCNGALTAQMTMLPEKTNYLTNGPDGAARLAQGPELPSYRGLNIIHSRKFSMDAGTAPRDLLRRRVRVAEYYRIPWSPQNKNRMYEFYDQSRDTMFRISWNDLCKMADMGGMQGDDDDEDDNMNYLAPTEYWRRVSGRQKPTPWHYSQMSTAPPVFLKIKSTNPGGAVTTQEYSDETGTLQALFTALGVPRDVFYKESSLLWPRAIEPNTNGRPMRKKYQLALLTDSECAKNNQVVTNARLEECMPEEKKTHHKMSEIIPLFNDHIVDVSVTAPAAGPQILRNNFNAMKPEYLMNGNDGHNNKLLHLRQQCLNFLNNHSRQQINTLENAFADKTVVCFGTVAQWDVLCMKQGMNAARNEEIYLDTGAAGVTHDNRYNDMITHMLNHHKKADINPVIPGNDESLTKYWELLKTWRIQYWAEFWRALALEATTNLRQIDAEIAKRNHYAHMNMLPMIKETLWVQCLDTVLNVPNEHTPPTNALLTTFLQEDDTSEKAAKMAYSIHNKYYNNQGIYAPNLHISRCDPLRMQDAENSATSMNPDVWILQQLVCMMPLNLKVCKVLLSSSEFAEVNANNNDERPTAGGSRPNANTEKNELLSEYAKFLTGQNLGPNGGAATTASEIECEKHYDTLLMHMYMSEFHPKAHIRSLAKHVIGLGVDQSMVSDFLHSLADCLDANQTYSDAITRAVQNMHPIQFTKHPVAVCTAVSQTESVYVVPYQRDVREPIIHTVGWKDMPVAQGDAARHLYTNGLQVDKYAIYPTPADATAAMTTAEGYQTTIVRGAPANNYINGGPNAPLQFYDAYHQQSKNTATHSHVEWMNPWMLTLKGFSDNVSNLRHHVDISKDATKVIKTIWHEDEDVYFRPAAKHMANLCRSSDPNVQDKIMRHVILVLANRFWKPTSRAMSNGQGLATWNATDNGFFFSGCHLMHGPETPTIEYGSEDGDVPQDLLILRPNIEHEMLGIIMGRGGTQELGATFWGQTELSCYDDAQHGIWGMSYKYHERAMVTNERNLIRVYDVAFDGYNGGMDQRHVNWNDQRSMDEFREATFDKTKAYNGPSMLVMGLPHDSDRSSRAWPNPIIFTPEVLGNISLSPEKEQPPSDAKQHMIFNCAENAYYCNEAQASKFKLYMQKLGMEHWSTVDQANRPAGECCIGNETSAHMFAFEGTMKVLDKHSGALIDATQGSGHLGPSFVGVASIREGRGIQNANMQPSLHRLI
tara:strand:- start:41431 stop:45861 length:4431 start_codon:yes stop_codon:yes gene_type:complete